MDTFTIVALPEESELSALNEIRNYLYTNNFRYVSKPNTSDVHISLTQAKLSSGMINRLKADIQKELIQTKSFQITVTQITSELRPPSEKCPKGHGWVALLFDDDQLWDLHIHLRQVLQESRCDDTQDYINSIMSLVPKLNPRDCIANHLNLANYCRPERTEAAAKYVQDYAPTIIPIDRIALRRKIDGLTVWTINLAKK